MHPCQQNYPCVYLSAEQDFCMLRECVLKAGTLPDREGKWVYDSLSGRLTPWVTVERKEPRPVDYLWDGVEPVKDGARKIVRG